MNFLRNYWQYLTLTLLVILGLYMLTTGQTSLPHLQAFLVYNFMALLAHQCEEYIFPGGGGIVINRGTYDEKDNFRRYPGNTQSSLLVNFSAYIAYVLTILFPNAIWLGIGVMFFNLMQFPGHVISNNKALKTWYNPGMATTILLFTPMSFYYFYYVISQGLVSGWDWLFGLLTFVALVALTVILPVQYYKNPDSPYVVPEIQVTRFERMIKWASLKK